MNRLWFKLAAVSVVLAGLPRLAWAPGPQVDPAAHPSRVYGYISLQQEDGTLHLCQNAFAPRLSRLAVVFKSIAGTELAVETEVAIAATSTRVVSRYPYVNEGGALASFSEIRNAVQSGQDHWTLKAIRYDVFLARNAQDIQEMEIEGPNQQAQFGQPALTTLLAFIPGTSQIKAPIITYDPTQWSYDRVEVGNLLYYPDGNSGSQEPLEVPLATGQVGDMQNDPD